MNQTPAQPSSDAIAQAFNEYLDINTGSKSAGTVMTEIWERAKELTAEEVVTGISDVLLLRALCEDVPDMHHAVRTQLHALADKIDSGAKVGVTRCRRCGDKAEVTIHESAREIAAQGVEGEPVAVVTGTQGGGLPSCNWNGPLPIGTRLYASPPHVADALDGERLDWLSWQHVEVRKPLLYGSHTNFHASPDVEENEPSDLRARIDAARAEAGDP